MTVGLIARRQRQLANLIHLNPVGNQFHHFSVLVILERFSFQYILLTLQFETVGK